MKRKHTCVDVKVEPGQPSSRVQKAAQQLALAAYDEAGDRSCELSRQTVTELKNLNTVSAQTLETIQQLGTADQLQEAKVQIIAAIHAQGALAIREQKAAARVQALQNALLVVDKVPVTTGYKHTPLTLAKIHLHVFGAEYQDASATLVRELLSDLLFQLLGGRNTCFLDAQYSVCSGRTFKAGSSFPIRVKEEFDKGMEAFHADLALSMSRLTGMPATAARQLNGKYTITITPP